MSQSTSLSTDNEPVMVTQDINLMSQIETTDQLTPMKVRDIVDPSNQHQKIKEKRNSAVTHFNYYLNIKNAELVANSITVTVRTFDELTYDDIDTGDYLAEYANYLSKTARKWCKPTQDLISYAYAAEYMGAVKKFLVDKYRNSKSTPNQISFDCTQIPSRRGV